MDTSRREALRVIKALADLNFPDEAFARLHHDWKKGRERKIREFEKYCGEGDSFRPDENNSRVYKRLKLVLDAFNGGGFTKPAKPEVFFSLVDAAVHDIPL